MDKAVVNEGSTTIPESSRYGWGGSPQPSESCTRNENSNQATEGAESSLERSECSSEGVTTNGNPDHGGSGGGPTLSTEATLEDFKRLGRDLESNIMQLTKGRIARKAEWVRARQEANLLGQKVEAQKRQLFEMQMKMESLSSRLFETHGENKRDVANKFSYITDLFGSIGENGEHLKARYYNLKEAVDSFTTETSKLVAGLKRLSKESLDSGNQYITRMKESVSHYQKSAATLFEEHKRVDNKIERKLGQYSQLLETKRKNDMAMTEAQLKLNALEESTASAENILERSKIELENAKQQFEEKKKVYTENVMQLKTSLQEKQNELELLRCNRRYLENQLAAKQENFNSLKETVTHEEEILARKCADKNLLRQELESLNDSIGKLTAELEGVIHERESLASAEAELERLRQEEAEGRRRVEEARAESARMEEELVKMKKDAERMEQHLEEMRDRQKEVQEENQKLKEEEVNLQTRISEMRQLQQNIKSEKLQELESLEKMIGEEELVRMKNDALKLELEAVVVERRNKLNDLENEVTLLKKEIGAAIQTRENLEKRLADIESKHRKEMENLEYLLDDAQEEYLELEKSEEGSMTIDEAREKLSQILEQKDAVDMCNEVQMKEIHKSFEEQLNVLDRKLVEIQMTADEKLRLKRKQIEAVQESINNLTMKKANEEAKIDANIPRLMKTISFGIKQLELLLASYKEAWNKSRELPSPNVIQNCTRLEELFADPIQNMASRYGSEKWTTPDPELFSKLLSKFREEFNQVTANKENKQPKDINKVLIELGFCIHQKNEANSLEQTPHMSCRGPKLNDSYFSTVSALDKSHK